MVDVKHVLRRWRKKMALKFNNWSRSESSPSSHTLPLPLCSHPNMHESHTNFVRYIYLYVSQWIKWFLMPNTSRRLWSLAIIVIIFHVITSLFQSSVFKLPHFDDVLALSFIETFIGSLISGAELCYMVSSLASTTSSTTTVTAEVAASRSRRKQKSKNNLFVDEDSQYNSSSLNTTTPSTYYNNNNSNHENNTLSLRVCCILSIILACSLYLSNTASHLLSFQLQVTLKNSKLLFTALIHRIVFGSVSSHNNSNNNNNNNNNIHKEKESDRDSNKDTSNNNSNHISDRYCTNTSEYEEWQREVWKQKHNKRKNFLIVFIILPIMMRILYFVRWHSIKRIFNKWCCFCNNSTRTKEKAKAKKRMNNNNNNKNIYTYCAQFVRSFLKVLFEVEFICCVLVVAGTVCFTLAENKQFAQKHIIDEHVHEPLANLHVKRPVEPIVLRETNTLRIKDHVIWEHTTLPHESSKYSLYDSNNNVASHDNNNNNINILKEESAELLNVAIEKVQEPQKEKREIIQEFNNLLEEEEEQEEEDKEGSEQTATSVIEHNHTSERKIIKKTPLGDVEVAITVAEVNNNDNDTMKQNESSAKETNTIVKDDEHRIVNNNNNNNNSNEEEEWEEEYESCNSTIHSTLASQENAKVSVKVNSTINNVHVEIQNEKRSNKEELRDDSINNSNKNSNSEKKIVEEKFITSKEAEEETKSHKSVVLEHNIWFTIITLLKLNTFIAVGCVILSNILDGVMYAVEEKYCLVNNHSSNNTSNTKGTHNAKCNNTNINMSNSNECKTQESLMSTSLENVIELEEEQEQEEELLCNSSESSLAKRKNYIEHYNIKTEQILTSTEKPSSSTQTCSSSSSSSSSSLIILNTLMFYMNCFAAILYGTVWVMCIVYYHFVSYNKSINVNNNNNNNNNITVHELVTHKQTFFTDYSMLWIYATCAALTSNIGTTALLIVIAEESSTTAVLITVIRKTLTILLSFCQYNSNSNNNNVHALNVWGVHLGAISGFTYEHAFGLMLLMCGLSAYEYVRQRKRRKSS